MPGLYFSAPSSAATEGDPASMSIVTEIDSATKRAAVVSFNASALRPGENSTTLHLSWDSTRDFSLPAAFDVCYAVHALVSFFVSVRVVVRLVRLLRHLVHLRRRDEGSATTMALAGGAAATKKDKYQTSKSMKRKRRFRDRVGAVRTGDDAGGIIGKDGVSAALA